MGKIRREAARCYPKTRWEKRFEEFGSLLRTSLKRKLSSGDMSGNESESGKTPKQNEANEKNSALNSDTGFERDPYHIYHPNSISAILNIC